MSNRIKIQVKNNNYNAGPKASYWLTVKDVMTWDDDLEFSTVEEAQSWIEEQNRKPLELQSNQAGRPEFRIKPTEMPGEMRAAL